MVSYDLKFILAVFRWATMAGDGAGGVLLDRSPCAGFPMPVEMSPKRPRMSASRYLAMLTVSRAVDPQFELALILGHETGHRCNSIRQLWWSDIRWPEQTIRWRGETDKQDTEHITPLTQLRCTRWQMHARGRWLWDTFGFSTIRAAVALLSSHVPEAVAASRAARQGRARSEVGIP